MFPIKTVAEILQTPVVNVRRAIKELGIHGISGGRGGLSYNGEMLDQIRAKLGINGVFTKDGFKVVK